MAGKSADQCSAGTFRQHKVSPLTSQYLNSCTPLDTDRNSSDRSTVGTRRRHKVSPPSQLFRDTSLRRYSRDRKWHRYRCTYRHHIPSEWWWCSNSRRYMSYNWQRHLHCMNLVKKCFDCDFTLKPVNNFPFQSYLF